MENKQIFDIVVNALSETLGVEMDEVTADATLLGDLGAESLDLLDVLFRIQRKLEIKLSMKDITEMIQGGIPDEEFGAENGLISDKGLDQLKKSLPQINIEELRGKFEAERVLTLFTVNNLTHLVIERMSTAGSTT
jgi:acyl carrier protein